MLKKRYDVVVVGSGIAGLTFALKVASKGHTVAIITKKNSAESNTNYAQGGIACVMNESDEFEYHVKDTLEVGDGLSVESVVRMIVREAPPCIDELVNWGVAFSKNQKGQFELAQEGGHSQRRILHVKDITGKAIEAALLDRIQNTPSISLLEHVFAIDLITQHKIAPKETEVANKILGLYVLEKKSGKVLTIETPIVMIATGGIGQTYLYTTNPSIATGDGIAMAYRVGVPIANMEFVQFHPTALYCNSEKRFLISEAVRGEGAILRNAEGKAFMNKYDSRGELASRDIVARAIDSEMKRSGVKHLWLDITHKSEAVLKKRFPNIYETLLAEGINIAKDWIPIVPAAHYLCGGIVTNKQAKTSLKGLYACGEAACTGLHGANRLASNSLLEAVVMAHRGAEAVIQEMQNTTPLTTPLPAWIDGDSQDSDERVVLTHNWEELRRTMWDYVGIVRTTKRLQRAKSRLSHLRKEIADYYWGYKLEVPLLELRNLIDVAELIIECALKRKESRGLHYNKDYPGKLKVAKNTQIKRRQINASLKNKRSKKLPSIMSA